MVKSETTVLYGCGRHEVHFSTQTRKARMRFALGGMLLTLAVLGCGGDDSNDPGDPFPDANGAYHMTGSFDDVPSSTASFTGTVELTHASQQSGTLGGSAALVAEIDGDIFNLTEDALTNATVSPSGVLAFTIASGGATWTFSGTLSGNNIVQGRHTLSDGETTLSGSWQGTRATGPASLVLKPTGRSASLDEVMRKLTR
jgi:hypothetical protein